MPSSFEFRALRCVQSPRDPHAWTYLPLRADVQRNADGAPVLSLVEAGLSGYLLFAAVWAAPGDDLEALRREIAVRIGEPEPYRVHMSFTPITAPRCNALVGDGSGAFQVLSTSTTSGFAPYNAAFNLPLRDAALAGAKAGLRGQSGFLAIEYLAEVPVAVSARAVFHSHAARLFPWIRSHTTGDGDLRHLLDEAVERGLATVIVDAPDDHLGQATIGLYERVMDEAARTLPRWLAQDASGAIGITAAADQQINEPIRVFADIGAIVVAESARAISGE